MKQENNLEKGLSETIHPEKSQMLNITLLQKKMREMPFEEVSKQMAEELVQNLRQAKHPVRTI